MKYKYIGDKKINLNGTQYRFGDIVELDSLDRVPPNKFVPVYDRDERIEVEEFECGECGKTFSSERGLNTHMRIVHPIKEEIKEEE